MVRPSPSHGSLLTWTGHGLQHHRGEGRGQGQLRRRHGRGRGRGVTRRGRGLAGERGRGRTHLVVVLVSGVVKSLLKFKGVVGEGLGWRRVRRGHVRRRWGMHWREGQRRMVHWVYWGVYSWGVVYWVYWVYWV